MGRVLCCAAAALTAARSAAQRVATQAKERKAGCECCKHWGKWEKSRQALRDTAGKTIPIAAGTRKWEALTAANVRLDEKGVYEG